MLTSGCSRSNMSSLCVTTAEIPSEKLLGKVRGVEKDGLCVLRLIHVPICLSAACMSGTCPVHM